MVIRPRPAPFYAPLLLCLHLAVVLLLASCHRAEPPPRPTVTVSPSVGTFPLACRNPAYCELGPDSICTIIYLARYIGTPDAQIREGVAAELPRLRDSDFNPCPHYRIYLRRLA